MRSILTTVAISTLFCVLFAGTANAKLGIGVGIGQNTSLRTPFHVTENFMLEPAIFYAGIEDTLTPEFASGVQELGFQLGAYFTTECTKKSDDVLYVGPLIGIILSGTNEEFNFTEWQFGAVLGGEYFLQPRFSLGVEGHFRYSMGAGDEYEGDGSVNAVDVFAVFVARFYFGSFGIHYDSNID